MTSKIFYVDRFSYFAVKIFEGLEKISKQQNYEMIFIGANRKDSRTWMSDQFVKNSKQIWDYGHFVRKLYGYIKKEKPNLVHFSFEWRTFGTITSSLKLPLLLILLKLKTKTKLIIQLHAPLISKNDSGWSIMNDLIPLKIPKLILEIFLKVFVFLVSSFSHRIIVNNPESKSGLVEFYGIKEEKIAVIEMVIPKSSIILNPETKKKLLRQFGEKKIILCFGTITPRKSYDLILKAFKEIEERLPDHILVIAGLILAEEKPYENMLHKLVTKLNLERKVFFTGYVDDEETEVLFDIADMVLYIYQSYPASSAALFFSIHHHKPCIVTNSDTFTQILTKKEAIFIEPNNEGQLSNAIFKLAISDKLKQELQHQMELASKKYSELITAPKYFKLYDELLINESS